jgi:hypothetical protein
MMSTVIDQEVVSAFPLSAEALKEYSGKWVAVRDGEVIASAKDFDELVKIEEVRATDALFRVPEDGTYFF